MYDWIIEADLYRLGKQRAECATVSERESIERLIAVKQKQLSSTYQAGAGNGKSVSAPASLSPFRTVDPWRFRYNPFDKL